MKSEEILKSLVATGLYVSFAEDDTNPIVQRHKKAIELARVIRPLIGISRPLLFHGTRSPKAIQGRTG
jgi:hypothetical protein